MQYLEYNKEEDYFNININEIKIIVDKDRISNIMNYNDGKKNIIWKLNDKKQLYYTLSKNNRKIYLIKILYPEKEKNKIIFINKNINDYREKNIEFIIKKEYINNNIKPDNKYKILKEGSSILIKKGKFANQWRNMYWLIYDEEIKEEYYLMNVNKTNSDEILFTKFSKKDLDYVLNFTKDNNRNVWYIAGNNYVACTYTNNNKREIIYLHQLIANWYGNGKGNMSVDHINRDKLDNRFENLRIVNQSDQNKNMDKKKRKYNAKKLPDNINELPKYVVYYKECYNKKENKWREFFKIEKHDKLDKPWCTSKSEKVGILDKLDQVNQKLYELNNNIKNEENKLPKYITYRNNTLIFDKKTNEKRYNMKMKTKNVDNDLPIFLNKIKEKYDI